MVQKLLLPVVILAASSLVVQSLRGLDYEHDNESANVSYEPQGESANESSVLVDLQEQLRDSTRLDDKAVVGRDGVINGHDAAVFQDVVKMEDADFAATKSEIAIGAEKVQTAMHDSNSADAAVIAARQKLKELMQAKTEASNVATEKAALLEQEKAALTAENEKLITVTKNFKKLDTKVADDQAEIVRLKEVETNSLAHLRHLQHEETTARAALAKQQVIADHRREVSDRSNAAGAAGLEKL